MISTYSSPSGKGPSKVGSTPSTFGPSFLTPGTVASAVNFNSWFGGSDPLLLLSSMETQPGSPLGEVRLQSKAGASPSLIAQTKQFTVSSRIGSISVRKTEKCGRGLSKTLCTIAIPVNRAVNTPVRTSQSLVVIFTFSHIRRMPQRQLRRDKRKLVDI